MEAGVFVRGKPFKPSLMFVDKARGLPWGGASERCLTRVGSSLRSVTFVKCFKVQTPLYFSEWATYPFNN